MVIIKQPFVVVIFIISLCNAMESPINYNKEYESNNSIPKEYKGLKDVENTCYVLLKELSTFPDPYPTPSFYYPWPYQPTREICLWINNNNIKQAERIAYIVSNVSFRACKDMDYNKMWNVLARQNEDKSKVGVVLSIEDSTANQQRCSVQELQEAMHNVFIKIIAGWKKSLICNTCIDGNVYQERFLEQKKWELAKRSWLLEEEKWFFITKPKIIRHEEIIMHYLIELINPSIYFESFCNADNTALYIWLDIHKAQRVIKKLGLKIE